MTTITVELTETQHKAFEYITLSPQDWVENLAVSRSEAAINEICNALMVYCNENEISIQVGKDAQVAQAFELGVVKTAAQRNEESSSTDHTE